MPGAMAVAILLAVATLQLQLTGGRSPWKEAEQPARVQTMSANSLIQAVKQYFKNGLSTLQGSMCDHLKRVLSKLSTSGWLHFSTNGPPHADKSLLSVEESYWKTASVQFTDFHMEKRGYTNTQEDPILFASFDKRKTTDITSILFPGQTFKFPHNNLLNLTFNCATGKLDLHIRLTGVVEIIPQVLSLSNLVLSIQTTIRSQSAPKIMILSTNTRMFHLQTFIAVRYNFKTSKFAIKGIPTDTSHLSQIPNIKKSLSSFPKAVEDVLESKIKSFIYDLQANKLVLHATQPYTTLIPNVLKLMSVTFIMDAVMGQTPTIKHLTLFGTWKIGTINLSTKVVYNVEKKLLHMISSPGNSIPLNVEVLMKKVAGVSHGLPRELTTFSLNNVMGNIYRNGRFLVAISGTVPRGKLYLLFYKGSNGVKVGIASSVSNFRLSDLIKTATGTDITSVPYFGTLTVPAIAIAITSEVIQSPTFPHLFGKGSPLLSYNNTLPAGITSQFHLDIGNAKGAEANFAHGMITCKLPKSLEVQLRYFASHIPGVTDAIHILPSEITSIMNAKVASFSFNSTSKDLMISGFLGHFTLMSGFLSLSNVHISYRGVLDKRLTTRSVTFIGTWQISGCSVLVSIKYEGGEKQLIISSQSQEEKKLRTQHVLESLAGTTVPLPPVISSLTFTGLSGKVSQNTAVIVVNGRIEKGRVSIVFEKSHSGSAGAVVADNVKVKLAKLIQSTTGIDISSTPFFGHMIIPELKFTIATDSITSPLFTDLAASYSPLVTYKNGIVKGVFSRFAIQIGEVKGIVVEFLHKKLSGTIPDTTSLSFETLLDVMPSVKNIVQKLPSQLLSISNTKVAAFVYDPTLREIHIKGSIKEKVDIIPNFVSLANVKTLLNVVLDQPIFVKTLEFSGEWILGKLPINTTVSYIGEEKQLRINGKLSKDNGGINIKKLIKTLSGQDLPIPSVVSSVSLTNLSGNNIGDVTLVSLCGRALRGNVYLIYQTSPSGSAIAFAVDTSKFRFSSLVSSTTGIDISDFPFFGTLTIPHIGFTISSDHINNPLVSDLYSSTSPLAKLGNAISKGVTATFDINFGSIQGIKADYAMGELDLRMPDSVRLFLSNILKLIPGVQEIINKLPTTLRDITSARMRRICFNPRTKVLQLSGSLTSLTTIPDVLNLQNIVFELSGIISAKEVKFAKFTGDSVINFLALTTEVTFEKILLIKGFPKDNKSLNIRNFITHLTRTELNIPSVLITMRFTQVIGNVQNGTTSLVLLGQIGSKGKVSLVYQKSRKVKIVAFAADLRELQLAELVKAGNGVDISSVPFFGKFIIPAVSFIISSKQFSTALLPDLKVAGVPKELFLGNIPQGVKGQFLADLGAARGINVEYSDNILTFKVPSSVSLSLQDLLSVIPEIKSTIDTLPSNVKDIINANVTKLVFKPSTKDLVICLTLNSLTVVPKIFIMKTIQVFLEVNMKKQKVVLTRGEVQKVPTVPHVTPFQFHTPALSISGQLAKIQAVGLKSLQMQGKWIIHGIEIDTSVTYHKDTKQLHIDGASSGSNGIKIYDLLRALSGADLAVPTVISSLRITKVVAKSDTQGSIVILSGTAGSADVYLVFQKTALSSAIAVAADIEEFKLADVIKAATGTDVSKVPFIGSFVISTLAFSAATRHIFHPLVSKTFDSDSPLQAYSGTLPKGFTAYFKAEISGAVGIEVSYRRKIIEFKVPPGVKLSLRGLLSEIPSLNLEMKALPSPLSDLLACNLVVIRFDPPTKTLSVLAKHPQITIIPNILEISSLDLSLMAILSSSGGLGSLDIKANWILRSKNMKINISYDRAAKEVLFAAIPTQVLHIEELTSITGLTLPVPSIIRSVSLTKMTGKKSADVFTLIFSGSIAGKADVHLVYQKFGTTSHIAIAAGIKSSKFADLVKSAVSIDITKIPFFGTFSIPYMGLVISNSQLTTPLLSQVLPANSPLTKYSNTLPNGFSAKFDIKIGSVTGIIGSYASRVLYLTVPPGVDASLNTLLSVIPGISINSLDIPHVLKDILKVQLQQFTFDIPRKEMAIDIFKKKMTFFEDLLSITNMNFKVRAKLSPPKSLTVRARGTFSIGNTDLKVDLERSALFKMYIITIETHRLPMLVLIHEFSALLLPEELSNTLGHAFKFSILKARIVYPLGTKFPQVMVSGIPELFGLKTIHMTAVAIKYGGKVSLIHKYSIRSISIADFIKKLLGISLHKLFLLNQKVDIGFTVSPSTLKGVSLFIPEFKDISIDKGISIKALLIWPSNCESDPFCAVAKTLLGGAKLSFQTTITNAHSFTMTASIGNLNLGAGVVLNQAGLQIVAGTSPTVGFVGSIRLKKPPVTLGAAVRATTSGVKLEGSMSGCWYNAFGSSYLTICNIFLAMTIIPSPLPISGLEFGGRIEVGKRSCGKGFYAEGYVGINVINPNENYFYADVGPVTFQHFFDAFCFSVSLPRPLADSGFPDGIKISFSLLGKELPHARISIPPGLRFKGTINILGLRAYADINIQPTRIYIKAGLPPLRIANIFKMYASRNEKNRGPYLIADISTSKFPHIEASGFVEVLGISMETKLLITSSKYEFSVSGRFLSLFNIGLRITASYGSISNANFMVEGWFKNDLFDRIAQIVRNGLKKSAEEADRHISAAQRAIASKKAAFVSADRALQNVQRSLDDAKKSFDYAIAKMEHARRKLNNICTIRSCGYWCIGCPRGWHCCARWWGACVCVYPGWDSCCWRIPDIICHARNAACWILKKALDIVLRAAIWIVDKSRYALDIAKGVLYVARGVVFAAKHTLDIAIALLEGVKQLYKIGVNALSALATFVLTKIINIREIYFKVGLHVASGGHFQCRVVGTLLGMNVNLNLVIDTRNIWSIAKSLADKLFSGLSNFIG